MKLSCLKGENNMDMIAEILQIPRETRLFTRSKSLVDRVSPTW